MTKCWKCGNEVGGWYAWGKPLALCAICQAAEDQEKSAKKRREEEAWQRELSEMHRKEQEHRSQAEAEKRLAEIRSANEIMLAEQHYKKDESTCGLLPYHWNDIEPLIRKYMHPEDDKIIHKALGILLMERTTSTSSLQRRLYIGYNKATELLALFEARGIVGPPLPSGSKREVLIFDEIEHQLDDQLDNL